MSTPRRYRGAVSPSALAGLAGRTGAYGRGAGEGGVVIEVSGTASTPLPPEELFEFVADASNNPLWQEGMRSCEWTTPPPIGIGSVYEQVAVFRGNEIRSTFEVVEFEEGRRIRIRTLVSTIPLDVTRRVEPVEGGGSRVLATVKGEAPGVLRALEFLARRVVARDVAADYRRLEEVLADGVPGPDDDGG